MRSTAIPYPLEDLVGWERSLMAFLVEKERRSGSHRTVEGYSRMLQDFFGRLSKTPECHHHWRPSALISSESLPGILACPARVALFRFGRR